MRSWVSSNHNCADRSGLKLRRPGLILNHGRDDDMMPERRPAVQTRTAWDPVGSLIAPLMARPRVMVFGTINQWYLRAKMPSPSFAQCSHHDSRHERRP